MPEPISLYCKDCALASRLQCEPFIPLNSPYTLFTCTDLTSPKYNSIIKENEPACRQFHHPPAIGQRPKTT